MRNQPVPEKKKDINKAAPIFPPQLRSSQCCHTENSHRWAGEQLHLGAPAPSLPEQGWGAQGHQGRAGARAVPISAGRMALSSRALQDFVPGAWLRVLPCAAGLARVLRGGARAGQGRAVRQWLTRGRNLFWKEKTSRQVVVV